MPTYIHTILSYCMQYVGIYKLNSSYSLLFLSPPRIILRITARNVHFAALFHFLFALFCFSRSFIFARDVTAVKISCHIFRSAGSVREAMMRPSARPCIFITNICRGRTLARALHRAARFFPPRGATQPRAERPPPARRLPIHPIGNIGLAGL